MIALDRLSNNNRMLEEAIRTETEKSKEEIKLTIEKNSAEYNTLVKGILIDIRGSIDRLQNSNLKDTENITIMLRENSEMLSNIVKNRIRLLEENQEILEEISIENNELLKKLVPTNQPIFSMELSGYITPPNESSSIATGSPSMSPQRHIDIRTVEGSPITIRTIGMEEDTLASYTNIFPSTANNAFGIKK